MPLNQLKNGKKHGRWIYRTDQTMSRGRYFKGNEIGTWKDFESGKLSRKERYRDNIALVKNYYPNRKIKSKGWTQTDITGKKLHWYFYGDWLYYDKQGKLIEKITFMKGNEIVSERY